MHACYVTYVIKKKIDIPYCIEQRKKSAKLKLSDLCDYFHLPIDEAADHEKVKLCPTVLKKTCRKAGLPRWPHRKVKVFLVCYTYLVLSNQMNISFC